jgi:phosphoglycolate phosphatase-like HAD superfamily hydrolase
VPPFKYKTIIFDFDGVLVDSVDIKGDAFCKMYEQYGAEIIQEVYRYHKANGGVTRSEKFKHFSKAFFNKELEPDVLQSMCNRFSAIVTQMVVNAPWIRGAREFLTNNWQQLNLHVASATPTNELLEIMEKRIMSHYFKLIKGSPSSKKNNVKEIISESSSNLSEVLMVGDAKTDFDAAWDNGIDFIGVGNDPNLKNTCSHVLEDLTQLEEYVSRH